MIADDGPRTARLAALVTSALEHSPDRDGT